MPSKKKNGKNGPKKVAKPASAAGFNITQIDFSLEVARQILGDHAEDKWVLSEVATAHHHLVTLWTEHVDDILRIAKKADGIAMSFTIKTSRASTPPLVKVGGNYSEKHNMKAESDAVDPEQMDLFGEKVTPAVDVKDETNEPAVEEEAERV